MSLSSRVSFLLASLLAACPGKPVDTGDSADSTVFDSGDTDADIDADADTDTDADTDSGVETGCDAVWFADVDGDGYGDPSTFTSGCNPPEGFIGDDTDCDDADPMIHPGAPEVCDGADNDCDAATPADPVVVDDGTSWPTIQDALDAAGADATVSLCPGTYEERLRIARGVHLVGLEGADATVIDGGGLGSTLTVSGGRVSLEGLTLTGGSGTLMDGQLWGGGVYAAGATGLEVLDCVVEGNTAEYGAGLVGRSRGSADDVITGTVFRDNVAVEVGGGFLLFRATLSGVESTGNEAGYGGGGAIFYWTVTADETTTIHDNRATTGGGGLMLWDEGSWAGGDILANTTDGDGGGIYISDDAALSGATVGGNVALGMGGGVCVDGARVAATSLVLTGNQAENGGGLALSGAQVDASACEVDGNDATENGGGIYLVGRSALTATGLVVHADVAGVAGGGAYLEGGDLTCDGCDFGEGVDENAPDDVTVGPSGATTSYTVGTSATFSCGTSAGGCMGI